MAKSLYRSENIELALLLRGLREQAGVVQGALAERMGKSQTFISNVELAIRRLDLVELRDYCAGLDIKLVELIVLWESRLDSKPRAKSGKSKR